LGPGGATVAALLRLPTCTLIQLLGLPRASIDERLDTWRSQHDCCPETSALVDELLTRGNLSMTAVLRQCDLALHRLQLAALLPTGVAFKPNE
jgi:hypothetical protein